MVDSSFICAYNGNNCYLLYVEVAGGVKKDDQGISCCAGL